MEKQDEENENPVVRDSDYDYGIRRCGTRGCAGSLQSGMLIGSTIICKITALATGCAKPPNGLDSGHRPQHHEMTVGKTALANLGAAFFCGS